MSEQKKKVPFRLENWMGRDLVAAARRGQLPPSWGLDDALRRVEEVLGNPGQSPVLVGDRGIGKTAVIHAVAARVARGEGPARLRGCRIMELKLRRLRTRYPRNWDARQRRAAQIFRSLAKADPPIVPYVTHLDVAYALDFEEYIESFLEDPRRALLGEGRLLHLKQVQEYSVALGEALVGVRLEEPRTDKVRHIVASWGAHQEEARGVAVGERAQRLAVALTDRFLDQPRQPQKALSLLQQTLAVQSSEEGAVGVPDVVGRFGALTNVPPRLIDPDQRLDLQGLEAFLGERLLGQEEAVSALVRMVALIKAGLSDSRRPFGSLLFVGPTGVGKTHATQLLATYLFGDRHRVQRLNMADYSKPEQVFQLFGHPAADRLELKRGRLHALLRSQPFGVLLLDELEKADAAVHDALLPLVDEGRYTNGAGEVVTASSYIIVATSNAGAEIYREAGLGFGDRRGPRSLRRELDKRLHAAFRFEFLNRFDQVVHFHPLDRAAIRAIAERELQEMLRRPGLVDRDLEVEVDVSVLDWLVAHGWHPQWGARFLRREMERNVTATLAVALVDQHPPPGTRVRLRVKGDAVHAEIEGEEQGRVRVPAPDGRSGARHLDRAGLVEALQEELLQWEAGRAAHEGRLAEAEALTELSQAPDFWEDPGTAQEVLRRFKILDARIQVEKRLLRLVGDLAARIGAERTPTAALLAALESSRRAWRHWRELGQEGGQAAWIALGPADGAARVSQRWLRELVELYQRWLARQGLASEVVAEEPAEEGVRRVVLEVEGPGAVAILEMEQGQHRRHWDEQKRARLAVRVVPRSEPEPLPELPDEAVISDARHVTGAFVGRRRARLQLTIPRRGLTVLLEGADRDTLRLLAHDLLPALQQARPTELARIYGTPGGGVRDPRTEGPEVALKRALRGHLDPFLDAWRAREPG